MLNPRGQLQGAGFTPLGPGPIPAVPEAPAGQLTFHTPNASNPSPKQNKKPYVTLIRGMYALQNFAN